MDGIERDVGDAAKVIRVELPTDFGRSIAARYGVEFTPTFLVFDATGRLAERLRALDRGVTAELLRRLSTR